MRPFKLRLLTTVAAGVMRNPVATGLDYAGIYRDGVVPGLETVGGALALAWHDGPFNVDEAAALRMVAAWRDGPGRRLAAMFNDPLPEIKLRPTRSSGLYQQRFGRIKRPMAPYIKRKRPLIVDYETIRLTR